MNRSNELYCEEDEEMERKRIILEVRERERIGEESISFISGDDSRGFISNSVHSRSF